MSEPLRAMRAEINQRSEPRQAGGCAGFNQRQALYVRQALRQAPPARLVALVDGQQKAVKLMVTKMPSASAVKSPA